MAASVGVLALVYMKIFLPESISMEETNALEIKLLDEESPTSEDSPSRNKKFFRGAPSFEDTLSLLKASKVFSQVAFVAFLNNVGDVGLHTSFMYYLKACFHFDKDDFANLMVMAGITGTVSQDLLSQEENFARNRNWKKLVKQGSHQLRLMRMGKTLTHAFLSISYLLHGISMQRNLLTDESNEFVFPNVLPGKYSLEVKHA